SQAAQASERAILAESQAAQASERAILAESQAAQAGEYTHALSQQLNAVLNSRSWKIFKPLREAGRFVRWFVSGSKAWLTFAAGSRPNRISRKAVGWVINKVRANPRLKELAITRLNKFPRLKQRLKKISLSQSNMIIQSHRNAKLVQPTAKLSPRARQIFRDLKSAMNKHNKEGV
ncbi:hypothetical protein HF673_12620, partial [Acidithiobacillus thiooxidans]|uniref:hypothetical protein n=1 Tax=Acidithiobacillus thiooxidans TaxID=930 RepID=UPI001C0779C6